MINPDDRKKRTAEIMAQFPAADKALADRCAWAELRLAEMLLLIEAGRKKKAEAN